MSDTAPRTQASRWLAAGSSTEADSRTAGVKAATGALAHDDAKLLVVFSSERHDPVQLLAGITEVTGSVPLIGCSTAGEITTDGPLDHGVTVTALGGPGFQAVTRVATGLTGRQRVAGAEVAGCVADLGEPPEGQADQTVLLMFSDGMVRRQEEVVRGAYGVLGAGVPLVGGCAGDDLRMARTWVLHDGQVYSDAVVGAALRSDAPMGIGVHHGWRKVGEPVIVSVSTDSHVYELGEEPALDVYLRRLDAPAAAYEDPAVFTRFAMTHPLALSRRGGEEMRFIAGADFASRALVCVADVPQGALAWFTTGDRDTVLDVADSACASAVDALAGASPRGLFTFDCIARRGVLGDDGIQQEVQRINKHAGGRPVAGFYTYGEIARVRGINGFHNQTLVVLAVS